MEVNHPEVCNLVVSKAQLLAIPLAKDNGATIFFFWGQKIEKSHKFENFEKIHENSEKSMTIHKLDLNQRKSLKMKVHSAKSSI